MLKLFSFFVLISAWGIHGSYAQSSTPQKHALIIAVGKYDLNTTGWWSLSSKDDAKLLHKTLQQIGFKPENIDTVVNERATKNGVLKSLDDLEREIKAGDIVVIHYSGHGQQLPDDNGDEEDKLDECLVLFGAKNPTVKRIPYDISGYLRDEEFGAALEKIRAKLGSEGHLLVVMDSCHSGSGARDVGDEANRGDHPYRGDTTQPVQDNEIGFGIAIDSKNQSTPNLCKYVFISAANANQLAKQNTEEPGKGFGALTYAFSKAIGGRSNNETYQSLFASIMSEIKGRGLRQTPTIEGDINYTLFGGDYIKPQAFFEILKIENDSIITIKGGKLVELYLNTKVAVVPAGKPYAEENVLATGTISQADNFEAEVKLNRDFVWQKDAAWVYVTQQSFSQQKLGVDLSKVKDKKVKERLTEIISASPLVESRRRANLFVEQAGNKLLIQSRALDRTLKSVGIENPDGVLTELVAYAKTSFLMKLQLPEDNYKVSARIIPVDIGSGQYGEALESQKKNGIIEVNLNQAFILEVTNKTDRITYFNILYLKESGETQVIVPCLVNGSCDNDPTSFELGPLKTVQVRCSARVFRKTEDAGMFKIIATSSPVNLCRTLQKPPAGGTRSIGNSIEEVLYKISNNESAGLNTRAVGDTEASTFDVLIALRDIK